MIQCTEQATQLVLDLVRVLSVLGAIPVGPVPQIITLFHFMDEIFLCSLTAVMDLVYGLY